MGEKKKLKRKLRRVINLYNIAILACIVVIAVSLYILIIKPRISSKKIVTPSGIEVAQISVKENEEITENQAKKLAVKQFKKLKENVKESDLKVTKIQRQGVEFYYVVSAENSVEIKILGGKITRINTAPVEE